MAASLGSVLWAGCSSTRETEFSSNNGMTGDGMTSDAASVSGGDVAASPVDQTKRRPDTHPELRNGIWSFSQDQSGLNPIRVIEASTVQPDEPGEANDTTALLNYNPEVINVAAADIADPALESGAVITEAAGASNASPEDIENYKKELEARVNAQR